MSVLRDSFRRFDGHRRYLTLGLEYAALTWLSRRSKRLVTKLDAETVVRSRRIAIVRSTNRIGNNIFLLPFLKAIKECHPDSEIDLICNGGPILSFIGGLGIKNCYKINLQRKGFVQSLITLWKLRDEHYDCVYVPFNSSTDYFIASWLKSDDKKGFDDPRGNRVFNYPIRMDPYAHYAHQPLRLIDRQASLLDKIDLGSGVVSDSIIFQNLAANFPGRPCVGFFTGARKGKGLSFLQWEMLLNRVKAKHPNALFIHIADPIESPLSLGDVRLTFNSLKELACFTSNLKAFISCDTGPLHLVAASGAPCLGLFTQTDPRRYGCLGPQHYNLVVTDRDTIEFDENWMSERLAPQVG